MLKNMKKTKLVKIVLLIFIIIFFLIFFLKNNYKNIKVGNNSIEEVEEYILNISSYEAKLELTVKSNKNTNRYIILQTYNKENKTKQVVLEPENIAGLEIEYDGQNLILRNTKLNIEKVYENYKYLTDNFFTLETFIAEYKQLKNNKTNLYEESENIIMEVEVNKNKYVYKKTLYIDKNSLEPTKLMIQDINEENIVYILYNEIEIK
jgi:outer membrane lipoprotein-sorting protein